MGPTELHALNRWILWRHENRNGTLTKVPVTITGQPASTTDPATWSSHADALAAFHTEQSIVAQGLGFVLGDGIVGIDLDHVRDAAGVIEPWAQQITNRLASYTEVSPSGTGLHILARGSLPEGRRRFFGRVEMYDVSRYFTITGATVGNLPVESRQDCLAKLHADLTLVHKFFTWAKTKFPREPYERLWLGERLWGDKQPFSSQSEADLVLCIGLARFANGDVAIMDRLFRLSGLFRVKWDEVHHADGSTYGQGTIKEAANRALAAELPSEHITLTVRGWRDITEQPLPPPEMLVKHLLLRRGINMIAGPSYGGKSSVALDIAFSVATGIEVLSKFSVPRQEPVLYVYAEQYGGAWEARLRAIAAFRGLPEGAMPPIYLCDGYEIRLNEKGHVESVAQMALAVGATTIFLDPLSPMSGAEDENSAAEVIRVARHPLERLQHLVPDSTINVVHHSTRAMERAIPHSAQDLVRGSGDLIAMTSTILGVWRSRSTRLTKVLPQGRGPMAPIFWLGPRGQAPLVGASDLLPTADPATSFDPLAFVMWESDADDKDSPARVVGVFDTEDQVLTTAEIAEALGVGERQVRRLLAEAKTMQLIRPAGGHAGGRRQHGQWMLVTGTPAPDAPDEAPAL